MSNFAYLHVHTRYSRNGGPAAPADWTRRATELGYTAVAVTDRAPLAAFPSLYRAAKQVGIAPLYGFELDIILPGDTGRKAEPVAQPALLFARNAEGIRNLFQLASQAYAAWPAADKPLLWDALAASAQGILLVLLGGDEAGAFTPFVTAPTKKLTDWARSIKAAFPDSAFVGLPHAGRPGDNALADQVAATATTLGIPVAATPTARYLQPEDAPAYEALKAARSSAGWPGSATTSIAPGSPGHDYLRTPDEAIALFARWPEAIENVARIVEMCALSVDDWPIVPDPSEDSRLFLSTLVEKALSAPDSPTAEYLQAEIAATSAQGNAAAWVALAAIADRAKQADSQIPTGAPTGSASRSHLAHALGITPTIPQPTQSAIRNPQSAIGIELPLARRESLVAGLATEYGPGRLAHAACSLPIAPAQAAQGAAIVLGVSGDDLKALALASLEHGWDAFAAPASDGLKRVAVLALTLKDVPLHFQPDPDTYLATPRQTHPTTTLTSYGPLLAASGGRWLPWSAEELGALQYPVFTLNPTGALATLDATITLARRYPTPGFQSSETDLDALPALTEAALEILHKGELVGIPYLAHSATKSWQEEAKRDAAAQLVARSLHMARPTAPEPKPTVWDEITASTGGALLFNDQLLALLDSFGIHDQEAQTIYRALLNPATDKSEAARTSFAEISGMPQEEATALWTSLLTHALLLIERSTAAAWGRTALWLVALKAGHPAAFLAGAFATASGRASITALAEEGRRLGITLLPPDVSASGPSPTLQRDGEGWAVLWGLDHLPGWPSVAATRFLAARPQAGFTSLQGVTLAAVDAGITLAQLEILVHSGACDNLDAPSRDRDAMLAVLPAMLEWAQATRRNAGQLDLFAATTFIPPVEEDLLPNVPNANPHSVIQNPKSKIQNPKSPRVRHLRRAWEETYIGVPFTDAPEIAALTAALEKSGGLQSRLITTARLGQDHIDSSINMVGILSSIRLVESGITTEKEPMAVAWLEDVEGSIELVAFPPNYKRHANLWVENSIVIVTARVLQHEDGEIYLLSEHIAPFQAETGEEAMTLTIKAPRQPRNGTKSEGQPATNAPANPTTPSISAMSVPIKPYAQSVGASNAPTSYLRPLPPLPPSSGEPSTYSLIISIPPADDDHTVIDSMIALNALLNAHPGPDTVTLRVQYSPENGKWTRAQLPTGVRHSHQLENGIRRLLGEDSLAVIKLLG